MTFWTKLRIWITDQRWLWSRIPGFTYCPHAENCGLRRGGECDCEDIK